jgi:hypothetical protein
MTDKEIAVIETAVNAASTIENLLKQGIIKGVVTQRSLVALVEAVKSYKCN